MGCQLAGDNPTLPRLYLDKGRDGQLQLSFSDCLSSSFSSSPSFSYFKCFGALWKSGAQSMGNRIPPPKKSSTGSVCLPITTNLLLITTIWAILLIPFLSILMLILPTMSLRSLAWVFPLLCGTYGGFRRYNPLFHGMFPIL